VCVHRAASGNRGNSEEAVGGLTNEQSVAVASEGVLRQEREDHKHKMEVPC